MHKFVKKRVVEEGGDGVCNLKASVLKNQYLKSSTGFRSKGVVEANLYNLKHLYLTETPHVKEFI